MLTDHQHRMFQDYKNALRGKYGPAAYESWLKPLALADCRKDKVVVCAQTKFQAQKICERFSDGLVTLWEERNGPVSSFFVRGGRNEASSVFPVRKAPMMKPVMTEMRHGGSSESGSFAKPVRAKSGGNKAAGSGPANGATEAKGFDIAAPLNQLMTFERFCVSDSNGLAAAAAHGIVDGDNHGLVYIHGGPGRGKTHLLNAIGQEWLRQNDGDNVLYLTYDSLLNGYVSAVMSKSVPELRAYLDQIDILLVDDVHMLRGRKATQEELFNLIDRLGAKGRTVVIAGSSSPAQLGETGVNRRLSDRLGGGVVVPVDRPDYALRLKVVRQMAERDEAAGRIAIPEAYLQMVARRCDASIRDIEGAYRTVRLKAETCNNSGTREMTEADVAAIIQERISYSRREVTLDDLRSAVADVFGLSVADMTSRRRPQPIVRARHAFCLLARKLTESPLTAIGAALGRDHTTVISSLDRAEVLAETDPVFGERIARLMDEYGE